jgi:hypothetical protein
MYPFNSVVRILNISGMLFVGRPSPRSDMDIGSQQARGEVEWASLGG